MIGPYNNFWQVGLFKNHARNLNEIEPNIETEGAGRSNVRLLKSPLTHLN